MLCGVRDQTVHGRRKLIDARLRRSMAKLASAVQERSVGVRQLSIYSMYAGKLEHVCRANPTHSPCTHETRIETTNTQTLALGYNVL